MKYAERVKNYLFQTIMLCPADGVDRYGRVTHGAKRCVAARVEPYHKQVTDATGRERVTDTRVFTTERVEAGDLVDGRVVREARPMVDGRGCTAGYELYL